MAKINRRSLFYWVRSSMTTGYWVEATTGGLSTDTLYGAVTSSATTIKIHRPSSDSTNEIVVGDRINIGEERMFVTDSSGATTPYTLLTVTRGYDGTTAIAHSGYATNGNGLKITRGVEALVSTTVIDSLHNARQVNAVLVNPSKNLFGTGVDVRGKLTDVFKPFQKILILDKATHQIIYTGYVKDIKDSYSMQQGKVISLQGVDILSELANFSSNDEDRFGDEGVIDGVDKSGGSITKISEQIEDILEDTGLTAISGVSRREAGNALLTTLSKNTTEANNNIFLFDASVQTDAKKYHISRGSWAVLRHIDNLSNSDSHDSEANKNTHVGYDFYATPYFVTPRPPSGAASPLTSTTEWTDNPEWQFNYFQRGSRPSSSTVEKALNIKYPLSTSDYSRAARPGASSPLDRPMKIMTTNASYVRSGNFIATSAIVTYTSEQDGEVESGTVQKTKEFELLYCNNLVKGSAEVDAYNVNSGYPIARGSGSTYRPRAISWSGNMLSGANPASGGVAVGTATATVNNTINALSADKKGGLKTEELGVAAELLRVETNSALDGTGPWTAYGSTSTAVARLQWLSAICPGDGEGTAGHYANGDSTSVSRIAAPVNSDDAIQMLVTFDLSDEPNSTTKAAMTDHNGLVRFVGMTSGFGIEFDNRHVTDSFWKGRPLRTLGVSRPKRLTIMDKPNLDDIRKEIAQSLVRDTRDIRKGTTAITEFPYTTLEGRVISVTGSSSTQRDITIGNYSHPSDSDVGAEINVAAFGLKSGMVMAFYDISDTTNNGEGDDANSNPYNTELVYGYVTSISTDGTVAVVTFPYDGTTAAIFPDEGDYVRAYIAMRAGDVVRLENALESVLGNHLILRSNFVDEGGAFTTNLETIGDNEDANLSARNLGGLVKPNITISSPGKHGETLFNTPPGQQNFRFFGRVFVEASGDRTVVNSVSWGGGSSGNDKFPIELGTGQTYTVAAGNSYAALHREGGVAIGALSTNVQSDINVVGTSSPGNTVWYTVYLDTSDTPDANGNYLLRVAPSSDIGTSAHNDDHDTDVEKYKSKTDHIRVFTIRSGSGGLDAEYQVYGEHVNWNKDTVRQVATATMIPDSFTAALTKKTLQPYTTTANVLPGDILNANKTRYIHVSANTSSSTDSSISFADDAAITLNASGNIDTYINVNDNFIFIPNFVHYIYFRLEDANDDETSVATAVDHAAVFSSYGYSDATSDSRGLLAICTSGSTSDQEVSIQAFHGKGQNINADVIAANAIITDSLAADAITAKHTITGATIQTAASAPRIVLNADKFASYAEENIFNYDSAMSFYNSEGTLGTQWKSVYSPSPYNIIQTAGTPNFPYIYKEDWFLIASNDIILYLNGGLEGQLAPYGNDLIDLGHKVRRFRDLWISGDITYAGSLDNTSDERIKTNITDFENADALTFINSLTPRKFNKHGKDILHYGLVAQEIETVLTGLSIDKTKLGMIKIPATETYPDKRQIGIDDDNNPIQEDITSMDLRTLDYTQFIAPLIGAIKELKRRLEILESA